MFSYWIANILLPLALVSSLYSDLNEANRPATIGFYGDVMLGRYVSILMDRHSSDYPFDSVRDLLQSADVNVVNLEGPITALSSTADKTFQFHFKPHIADLLSSVNIGVVGLANNHLYDQGRKGVSDTRENLTDAGLRYFGDPYDVSAETIFIDELGDREVIYVGADLTMGGTDVEDVTSFIRTLDDTSYIIVSVHWGEEYTLEHSAGQKDAAHKIIDAGADLIIGHHPHVVQDIGLYKDTLIFYSLGNFVFDQYFSDEVKSGLAVHLTLSSRGQLFTLHPLWSDRSNPAVMEKDESDTYLRALATRSDFRIRESIKEGEIFLEIGR
jgi:gamma-polyglutamate biosynthesis protein CapA